MQYTMIIAIILLVLAIMAIYILGSECEEYEKEINIKDKTITKLLGKQKLDRDIITGLGHSIEEQEKEIKREYEMKCYYKRELGRIKDLCKKNNIDYKIND